MTNKKSKSFLVGGASFLALLFLSWWVTFPLLTFEINEKLYWTTEKNFTLKWIHSVEKEEWIEFYEKKEKTILLTTTAFKTFGAGVPSTPKDGQHVTVKDGYVTMDINRSFPSLELIVSENVKSTLVIKEKEILLYALAGDYEPVTISVQPISLWDMLLKGESL